MVVWPGAAAAFKRVDRGRHRGQDQRPALSARPAARQVALDRTLAALADPVGRRAVDLLGERPHTAGELADKLGVPAPAMSRRLTSLRRCGLVQAEHPEFDARVRIYSLRAEPMRQLKRWLEHSERLWSEQLSSFKAHVEKDR